MTILKKSAAVLAAGIIATMGAVPALASANTGSVASAFKTNVAQSASVSKLENQDAADQAAIDALTSQPASATVDAQLKALGDKMTANRVAALTLAEKRINNADIATSTKTTLVAKAAANINSMTALKAKIDADTDHATLVADVESITKAYRVYRLVLPQLGLMTAAAHANVAYAALTAKAATLQTEINAMSNATDKAAAQALLNDLNAKIAAANTTAAAANAEIANLIPDNGDQTVLAANNAALADATTKLATAHTDFQAARKDARQINGMLHLKTHTKKTISTVNPNTIMKVHPSKPVLSTTLGLKTHVGLGDK